MKLSLLTAVLTVTLSCSIPLRAGLEPDGGFVRGEVNGDGTVDVSDPVRIILLLFVTGLKIDCDDSADVNDDGVLNIADPARELMYLFGDAAPPPAPFARSGPDPTPDALCCRDTCNPDLDGFWSGTFVPTDGSGEYVVSFEVEDAAGGSFITSGLESLGNAVLGGEIVILAGTGDRLLSFRYDTTFDSVAGEFAISSDGMRMESGEYATTSGTEGTFSMARVLPGSVPVIGDGGHSIVFVDSDDNAAWGGVLTLADDGCVSQGVLSGVPVDAESSKIERWPHDPASDDNNLPGVYTGSIVDAQGYAVNLLGLLAADELLVHGLFTDSFGVRGVFLVAPRSPASEP